MAKSRIGTNPLDSLLGAGEQSEETPEEQQPSKTESREAGKTVKQNDSKTVKHKDGKGSTKAEPEGEKVKATFYLPADVESDLEAAWLQLRRLTGRKVSKSEIVAEALRAVAADVEGKGERSAYAKRLRQ